MRTQDHTVVAVCDSHAETEETIRKILKAGIDSKKLSVGVPRSGIQEYEKAVRQGKIILVLYGTENEVTRAREILATSRPVEAIAQNTRPDERCTIRTITSSCRRFWADEDKTHSARKKA